MIWEKRVTARDHPELRDAYNRRHEYGFLRDRDRFYQMLARRMRPSSGDLILDSGCGGAYLLRELAECSCYGVDISDVALEEARRVAPSAHLALAGGECLPFPSNTFHQTVCLGNLEHFLDPGMGARELARVTRPDGQVWVLLPNSYYSGDLWRVIRFGYGPDHHQPMERFGTINEWRDFLQDNGLRVLAVQPYNRFKWWKRLLPRALAYHFLFRCEPSV